MCSVCYDCLVFVGASESFKSSSTTWQLHEIGVRALELVQEFWDVHCKEASSTVRPPLVRWTPLPAMCYKLNFDAALLDGFNQVWLGVVCRDSQGHMLATLSQKVGLV